LRARGHGDAEITALFSRFDTDGDRVLNMSEMVAMNVNLAREEKDLDNDIRDMKEIDDKMDGLSRLGSSRDGYSSGYTSSEDSDGSRRPPRMTRLYEHERIVSRVKHIQDIMGDIVEKVEFLHMKLDTMENSRNRRRNTMNQMLDDMENAEVDERRTQMEKLVRDELEMWDVELDKKMVEEKQAKEGKKDV